jgi:hypothetical protein
LVNISVAVRGIDICRIITSIKFTFIFIFTDITNYNKRTYTPLTPLPQQNINNGGDRKLFEFYVEKEGVTVIGVFL